MWLLKLNALREFNDFKLSESITSLIKHIEDEYGCKVTLNWISGCHQVLDKNGAELGFIGKVEVLP